jgi:hypothetical protein
MKNCTFSRINSNFFPPPSCPPAGEQRGVSLRETHGGSWGELARGPRIHTVLFVLFVFSVSPSCLPFHTFCHLIIPFVNLSFLLSTCSYIPIILTKKLVVADPAFLDLYLVKTVCCPSIDLIFLFGRAGRTGAPLEKDVDESGHGEIGVVFGHSKATIKRVLS